MSQRKIYILDMDVLKQKALHIDLVSSNATMPVDHEVVGLWLDDTGVKVGTGVVTARSAEGRWYAVTQLEAFAEQEAI